MSAFDRHVPAELLLSSFPSPPSHIPPSPRPSPASATFLSAKSINSLPGTPLSASWSDSGSQRSPAPFLTLPSRQLAVDTSPSPPALNPPPSRPPQLPLPSLPPTPSPVSDETLLLFSRARSGRTSAASLRSQRSDISHYSDASVRHAKRLSGASFSSVSSTDTAPTTARTSVHSANVPQPGSLTKRGSQKSERSVCSAYSNQSVAGRLTVPHPPHGSHSPARATPISEESSAFLTADDDSSAVFATADEGSDPSARSDADTASVNSFDVEAYGRTSFAFPSAPTPQRHLSPLDDDEDDDDSEDVDAGQMAWRERNDSISEIDINDLPELAPEDLTMSHPFHDARLRLESNARPADELADSPVQYRKALAAQTSLLKMANGKRPGTGDSTSTADTTSTLRDGAGSNGDDELSYFEQPRRPRLSIPVSPDVLMARTNSTLLAPGALDETFLAAPSTPLTRAFLESPISSADHSSASPVSTFEGGLSYPDAYDGIDITAPLRTRRSVAESEDSGEVPPASQPTAVQWPAVVDISSPPRQFAAPVHDDLSTPTDSPLTPHSFPRTPQDGYGSSTGEEQELDASALHLEMRAARSKSRTHQTRLIERSLSRPRTSSNPSVLLPTPTSSPLTPTAVREKMGSKSSAPARSGSPDIKSILASTPRPRRGQSNLDLRRSLSQSTSASASSSTTGSRSRKDSSKKRGSPAERDPAGSMSSRGSSVTQDSVESLSGRVSPQSQSTHNASGDRGALTRSRAGSTGTFGGRRSKGSDVGSDLLTGRGRSAQAPFGSGLIKPSMSTDSLASEDSVSDYGVPLSGSSFERGLTEESFPTANGDGSWDDAPFGVGQPRRSSGHGDRRRRQSTKEDNDEGGSDSDSSIDLHTPLPHLMFRDGLLSPRSKLFGGPGRADTPTHAGDLSLARPGSMLSLNSTGGSSVMTKSGILKDDRDTVRRRTRHRDGKLLRGGIGLTTGLGWSDSEDEDAPSPLTRRLSALTLARRSSDPHGSSRRPRDSTASSPHPLSRSVSAGENQRPIKGAGRSPLAQALSSTGTSPSIGSVMAGISPSMSTPSNRRVPSTWRIPEDESDLDDVPTTTLPPRTGGGHGQPESRVRAGSNTSGSSASVSMPLTPEDVTPTNRRFDAKVQPSIPRRVGSLASIRSVSSTASLGGKSAPASAKSLPRTRVTSGGPGPQVNNAASTPNPASTLTPRLSTRMSASGVRPLQLGKGRPLTEPQSAGLLGYNRNVHDAQRASILQATPPSPLPGAKPRPRIGAGMVYRSSTGPTLRSASAKAKA